MNDPVALIGCSEDVEEFRSVKPHRRFYVWKGRDVWHKELCVQIRLEEDGSVFLSTLAGSTSAFHTARITLDELYALIRPVTEAGGIPAPQ